MTDMYTHTVHEYWIFSMISFGFIGFVIITCIILYAAYNTYRNVYIEKRKVITTLVLLNFSLWVGNAMACALFAAFRTNIFINLSETKCVIIYITNYFCYMLAKYCLHILLLYRLYAGFQGTSFELKSKLMKVVVSIMTVNFVICTSLWVKTCVLNVAVGVTSPHKTLQICTLYNNDVHEGMDFYHKVWPVILGVQDFIVSITIVAVFASYMRQLTLNTSTHGHGFQSIIRKLIVLGLVAILSTCVFYTFAVIFYPNLTFLLPIDCTINSLCIFLLLDYAKGIYNVLCYVTDKCLVIALRHKVLRIDDQIINSMVHIHNELHLRPVNTTVSTRSTPTCTGTPICTPVCTDGNMSKSHRRSTKLKFDRQLQVQSMSNSITFITRTSTHSMSMSMSSLKNISNPNPNSNSNANAKPLALADSRFVHSAFL